MESQLRQILYTGFKGEHNSSYILVDRLKGDKIFLTNSFKGLKEDIEKISKKFDVVYMFGLDKNLNSFVRIEKCARKDNELLYTKIGLDNISNILAKCDISNSISETPTYYLCNEAYYYMLKKMNGRAVFIHIPSKKNMTDKLLEGLKTAFELVEVANMSGFTVN